MNALLDTSALTAVLNNVDRRANFDAYVKSHSVRVIVPSSALDELFTTKDSEKLAATVRGLVALNDNLGRQLDFAAPHADIWRAEF